MNVPLWRTRAFVGKLGGAALAYGLLFRFRIHLGIPMPTHEPFRWFLFAFLQDLALFGLLGAVAMFVAERSGLHRSVRALFGLFFFAYGLLFLVRSEAVITLGAAIHPEDTRFDLAPTVIAKSLESYAPLLVGTTLGLILTIVVAATWSAGRTSWRWPGPRLALVVGLLALGGALLFPPVHRGPGSRNPVVSVARLLLDRRREPPMASRLELPPPQLPLTTVRELASRPVREFPVSEEYPFAHEPPPRSAAAPRLPPGLRPNVVLVLVEGLRAEEVGVYGGNPVGITPNLDELARHGIRVDPAYSVGTTTPAGELGAWYGLPPVPQEALLASHPLVPVTGLPEMLRAAGWKSILWIHGGEVTFYGRDRFYGPRHVTVLDGRDFPPTDPHTYWGFTDRSLARHAVASFDRTAEPFAAMVLTVSTHHPYEVPPDGVDRVPGLGPARRGFRRITGTDEVFGIHTVPFIETVHYADRAIGDFFERARKRPWFERTIFVITGDHGNPIAPNAREIDSVHDLDELRTRVPLIIYSPLLEGGKVIEGPGSHEDILPTIAGLAGLPGPIPGLGIDLLDPAQADPSRPVIHWSHRDRMFSVATAERVYHAAWENDAEIGRSPAEEILIDPRRDPRGLTNLVESEARSMAAWRRLLRVYGLVYPWVVEYGRSGLPPEPKPKPRR